jgi:hypothetical protein
MSGSSRYFEFTLDAHSYVLTWQTLSIRAKAEKTVNKGVEEVSIGGVTANASAMKLTLQAALTLVAGGALSPVLKCWGITRLEVRGI